MATNERIVRLKDGNRVIIQGRLQQQRHWLRGRYYEGAILSHIRKRYHGGTFIDGGACIGNHTLFFARHCASQVIAVEPVARNVAHLRRNVELSCLQDKVIVVAAALGASPGRAAMKHAGDYHGQYNLVAGDAVDVTTLDAVATLADYPIRLIKLDIEGGEIKALQGGIETLRRCHPVLCVELLNAKIRRRADKLLKRLGYVRTHRFAPSRTYEYK